MQIKELHVYGYGKLENETFTDLGALQIFYGENESGKTTIMSFVHSILFGFPTKVQTERRYEPKLNAKYGGRVLLFSEQFGEVSIERVKGKATGDVTVTFEDGKIGNENDLAELLQGIDKNHFQSVFSFDLQGLYGVQNLNQATLGKYLLSAGMIGSDKLLEAETKLQKELDARFKPSGQKPELNVKLKQLKDLQARLKKADDEQRAYTELQSLQKQTEAGLSQVKEAITENENRLFHYQEFLRIQPLFVEKQIIETRLQELGGLRVPIDGLKRLEQLIGLKIPNDAQLAAIQKKKLENNSNIEKLNISPYVTANKEKIRAVLEHVPLVEKMEAEHHKLEQALQAKQREKEKYKQDLSIDLHDDEIGKLDTSTFTSEKIKELEREKHRLKSERIRLDEKYKQEKSNLEITEAKISELNGRRLPDKERKRLENADNSLENETYALLKKEIIEEQIADLNDKYSRTAAKEKSAQKRTDIISALLALICLAISVYAFTDRQYLLVAISILFAAIAISSRFFTQRDDVLVDLKQQLAEAEHKKKKYELQTETRQSMELDSVRHLLQKEEEIRQQLLAESFKQEQRAAAFDSVIQEFERWEASWKQLSEELSSVMKKWKLPVQLTEEYQASAVMETLLNVKQAVQESGQLKNELDLLGTNITQQKRELLSICEGLRLHAGNWREATVTVKQALNDHMEQSLQLNQYKQEKIQLVGEMERLQSESSFLSAEMNQLFHNSQVENEEEFRKKAMLAEEKENLKNKLHMISIQLKNSILHGEEVAALSNAMVNQYSVEALESERRDLLGSQSSLLERLSEVRHQIRHLEEGGTYNELLHQYNETKAIFNAEAKVWAKYALAKSLLNKTILTFKKERMPKVIAEAEEYLSFLTDGEYKKILLGETGDGLYLERHDGLRFEAGEVSRGTAEQVYVSLRLALAHNMFTADGFPIIIDDSFVNFDNNRTKHMIQLLQKLSKTRQVIFFTCHQHLLRHFGEQQIIILGKEEAMQNVEIQS